MMTRELTVDIVILLRRGGALCVEGATGPGPVASSAVPVGPERNPVFYPLPVTERPRTRACLT
jgi:hypothetical protein